MRGVVFLLTLLSFSSVSKEYIHSCEYSDRQSVLDALSCNLYFEARSQEEGVVGLYAVAFTTINRVLSDRFPDNLVDVVYQPYAFSWTKDGRSDKVYDRKSWELCRKVANIVLEVKTVDWKFYDITRGALFYHANYITPAWAGEKYITVKINNHIFYHNDVKK